MGLTIKALAWHLIQVPIGAAKIDIQCAFLVKR